MLRRHMGGARRTPRTCRIRDSGGRDTRAGACTSHHQQCGGGHRAHKVQPRHPEVQISRHPRQGDDRPEDTGKDGGREPPDRGPVGGAGLHITLRHRDTGREAFRNKRSRFPT